MNEKGIASSKDVLLNYLIAAADIDFKNVYFPREDPLPDYSIDILYVSRILIPLVGIGGITAVYDQKIESREIVPGDIIFTAGNCWASNAYLPEQYKSVSIVIMPNYVRLVAAEYCDNKLIFNPYYHTNSSPSEIMLSLIHALSMLRYETGASGHRKELLLLKALLLETIDMVKKDEIKQLSKSELSFKLVKEYIDHNYHLPINVEQICHDLGYNPSYISRMFKKLGNQNIKNYLEERRMTAAKEMLSNVELRLAQIARQCGYSSEAYFIKVFKKFYGITPGEFRLENQ